MTSLKASFRAVTLARHITTTSHEPCITAECTSAQPGSPALNGIRVVELATVVAAPTACAVLADFGADVIKVENSSGDPFRKEAIGLQPSHEHGAMFDNFNRGKRSVVLDLTKEADKASMLKLIASADVFVTNVRADPLSRLNLDYETLHAKFPRLVYGHLTAWGREGPQKDSPGYDAGAYFAATGMQDLLRPNEEANPPRYPAAFGDLATSLQLVGGLALALFHRERTGEGQLVDASLLRQGIWMLGCPMTMSMVPKTGKKSSATVRGKRNEVFNPLFNSYCTKDKRWLMLLGLELDRHFPKVMQAMELESLKTDERFESAKKIVKNKRALVELLDARFAERTLDEWVGAFDAADVWYAVTKRYEDVPNDLQAIESGAFVDVPGVDHRLIASPMKLSCAEHKPSGPAPNLGQHTKEVLDSL